MNLAQKIEGYLFFLGEPIDKHDLVSLFKVSEDEIHTALNELKESLQQRGIVLVENQTTITLGTHPELGSFLEKIQKDSLDKDLSKAALETLSVILYMDMPTRSDIDYIRGVNSQFSLRMLLVRGLIDRQLHPKDNRKFVYLPTTDLLSFLGVGTVHELPNYIDVKEKIAQKLQKQEAQVVE